jgi:hypothetical protein
MVRVAYATGGTGGEGKEMSGELIEKIVDQGGLFAVFVLGLWMFSRVAWWMGKRLLDAPSGKSKGGVLVQWFESHQEFLKGLEHRDKQQLETCKHHVDSLKQLAESTAKGSAHTREAIDCIKALTEWAGDPDAPFSTMHFNHSMVDLAKARLLEMSIRPDTPDDEARAIVAQVEALLKAVEDRHRLAITKVEQSEDPRPPCERVS